MTSSTVYAMTKRTRIEIITSSSPPTDPPSSDARRACTAGTSIVDFLEARITEKEASVRGKYQSATERNSAGVGEPGPLGQLILAECTMKRSIIAEWRSAAEAEGAGDIYAAEGPAAVALRSMLIILAAGYETHPDYCDEWIDRQ